jgi:hypothetical protein
MAFLRFILVGVCYFTLLGAQPLSVPLTVPAGAPLRLYLTQRAPMHLGAPVSAKLIEPIYAFDRVVIPAGTVVQGNVTKLDPVSKLVRAHALMGGDFTPLHRARVEFTGLKLPDGRTLPIHTASAFGLPTLYGEPKPPKPPKHTKTPASAANGQTPAAQNQTPDASQPQSRTKQLKTLARQEAKKEINSKIDEQLNARTYGLGSLVRGPNKKERLEDFVYSKLPYRPQFYRRGTRFDGVLENPLEFGSATVDAESLSQVGTEAPQDSVVQLRFLSSVSSATAAVGDPVEAVLSEPLRGTGNKLIFPEGTHLAGRVRMAQHARWLHRSGKLRFTFDQVSLPPFMQSLHQAPLERTSLTHTDARLLSAETDPQASVKIDSEGSAKATEPKSRLLAPAISALVAMKSMDNDSGKPTSAGGNGAGNAGGTALGGFSGFGLLGVAAARASATAGSALGMWGLAVSVYSSIITPGHDVEFEKNSSIVVRFGARLGTVAQAGPQKP